MSRSPVLVGIDVGTSSTKCVVVAPDGTVLGLAAQETAVDTPRPGWAEQDPEAWVGAALSTTRSAMASAGIAPGAVQAVGLSGQMHGTVCVGASGRPLRPAVIWADQRTVREVAELRATLGADRLAAWTGNPPATGFMLPTWVWLREHEPETMAATRWLMLPKDYVRYRLTGEPGAEPSDAASTSLFNPVERAWSEPLLEALDLPGGRLPPVYPSAGVAGGLLPGPAEVAGLRPGTPVIYGGSDQAMQAFGNGVISPGIVSSTIGTGGQLFAPTDRPVVDAPRLRMHSFCHILPSLWHVETAMLSAGLSLRWLRDQVLGAASYEEIVDTAQTVQPGADGLFFQPYLAGERTPHMDPRARGSFVGLTRRHTRAHLVRAVMEGVVFGMRQGLDVMLSLSVPVDLIVASGGATRHPLWLQLQADIYDRPIHRTASEEAAAMGAALLAGVGVGLFANAQTAIRSAVHWHEDVIRPDPDRVDLYEHHYRLYSNLYPALASTDWSLGMVAQ